EALAHLTPSDLVKQVSSAYWGTLQEARVVSKEKALETYEDVVRGRIDPALLEYAGGNTFTGRVFPIPPRGYNRVILAYEELLPVSRGRMVYRFPLPGRKLEEMRFALQASAAECVQTAFLPRDAKKEQGKGRVLSSRTWNRAAPGGEAAVPRVPSAPRAQAVPRRQGANGPYGACTRIVRAVLPLPAGDGL